MAQLNYAGRVLIISSEESADLHSKNRKHDRESLTIFLGSVNYEIIELIDATEDVINTCLSTLPIVNLVVPDIFLCIILSNETNPGYFQIAHNQEMSVNSVMEYFSNTKCPTLLNVPKLFLVNTTCNDNIQSIEKSAIHSELIQQTDNNEVQTALNTIIQTLENASPVVDCKIPTVLSNSSSLVEINKNSTFLHTLVATTTHDKFLSTLLNVLKEYHIKMNMIGILQIVNLRLTGLPIQQHVIKILEYGVTNDIFLIPNVSLHVQTLKQSIIC
jgi:hypothetical protein